MSDLRVLLDFLRRFDDYILGPSFPLVLAARQVKQCKSITRLCGVLMTSVRRPDQLSWLIIMWGISLKAEGEGGCTPNWPLWRAVCSAAVNVVLQGRTPASVHHPHKANEPYPHTFPLLYPPYPPLLCLPLPPSFPSGGSFVRPSVCLLPRLWSRYFETNQPILLNIGTSGARCDEMKRSTLGVTRTKVEGQTTPKLDLEVWRSRHCRPVLLSRDFFLVILINVLLISIATIASQASRCRLTYHFPPPLPSTQSSPTATAK